MQVKAQGVLEGVTVVCSHVRRADRRAFTVVQRDGVFAVVELAGMADGKPSARIAMGFHTVKAAAILFAKLLAYGPEAKPTRKAIASLPGMRKA